MDAMDAMDADAPIIVDADALCWNPARAWPAAVEHLHRRFGRVAPLPEDVRGRLAAGTVDLAADLDALGPWAPDDLDLDRELARFFDEHMPLYVRPDRPLLRDLAAVVAAGHELRFATLLGEAAATAALRHAGVLRLGMLDAATPVPAAAIRDRSALAPTPT